MAKVDFSMHALMVMPKQSSCLFKSPNEAQGDGFTAFHAACLKKHWAIADYLIDNSEEFGINLLAKDEKGRTSLQPVKLATSRVLKSC